MDGKRGSSALKETERPSDIYAHNFTTEASPKSGPTSWMVFSFASNFKHKGIHRCIFFSKWQRGEGAIRECITITNLKCFVRRRFWQKRQQLCIGNESERTHGSSDIATQPLICKQNFLTVSLHFCLLLAFFSFFFPPHPLSPLFLPSPRNSCSLSFPSDRAKRDPREEKERFVELDFAVLDIIHPVLFCAAVRSPVKPAWLL